MNQMNSSHHVKEHPKISNFLQFESQAVNVSKLELAVSDLRDLYGSPTSVDPTVSVICMIDS